MSKEANQSKRRYFPLRDASNPYKVKIAEQLGRKQRTFADQMKKIRTELRKIRGY